MNKLFVHSPWFRLLAPVFSGMLMYFLILLINDAVLSIQDSFLSQELFVCIALAYLTQEFSRLLLLVFERVKWFKSFVFKMVFQLLSSVILTICLVSVTMYLYFKHVLLFEASFNELVVFNSIFSFITILYVVLYLGHFFLFKKNSRKIEKETLAKLNVELDFVSYLKGINPELLFESLEAMLVTMKDDASKAEQLSDYFSSVYRYILSKRNRELVGVEEEIDVVKDFVQLLNHLPNRKVKLGTVSYTDGKVIPTTLLKLIEAIIRTTIVSKKRPLSIEVEEKNDSLYISYEPEERLQESLTLNTLSETIQGYRIYSETPISVKIEGNLKVIELPKLTYDESGNS